MSPEQMLALLALLADLRIQVAQVSAENADLRAQLDKAAAGPDRPAAPS